MENEYMEINIDNMLAFLNTDENEAVLVTNCVEPERQESNVQLQQLTNCTSENLKEINQPMIMSNAMQLSNCTSENLKERNQPINATNEELQSEPSQNTTEDFILTNSTSDLTTLLNAWGLLCIQKRLEEKGVDLLALKYAQPHHIKELFSTSELGMLIKFERLLSEWQKQQGTYDPPVNKELSSLKGICGSSYCSSYSSQTSCSSRENSPTPSSSKDINSELITLEEILKNGEEGRALLEKFKTEELCLSDNNRRTLINTIVNYYIQNNIIMTVAICDHVGDQIVALFKNEIKQYYIVRQFRRAPKGKLFIKYNNRMRQLRESGLFPKKRKHSSQNIETLPQPNNGSIISLEDGEELRKKLIYYNENWDDLKIMWTKSAEVRKQFVQNNNSTAEIFSKWPAYTRPLGHELIDIDFNHIHPRNPCIIDKWECLIQHAEFFGNYLKDEKDKTVLKKIVDDKTIKIDSRNVAMAYLLHAVFLPNKKFYKNTDGKKSVFKYSINDSRDAFFILCPSANAVTEEIEKRKKQNSPIQPIIILIGDDIFNIKEMHIYYDEIKYTFFSFVRVLDICFKIFNLFNLKYPNGAMTVWMFIQIFFYNMRTKYDERFPVIERIIKDIEDELKNN